MVTVVVLVSFKGSRPASRIQVKVICPKVTSGRLMGLYLRSGLALTLLVLHVCPLSDQPRPLFSGVSYVLIDGHWSMTVCLCDVEL